MNHFRITYFMFGVGVKIDELVDPLLKMWCERVICCVCVFFSFDRYLKLVKLHMLIFFIEIIAYDFSFIHFAHLIPWNFVH